MRMKKMMSALAMSVTIICSNSVITAYAGSMNPVPTPYGNLQGYSYQGTWQQAGSPVHKKIFALSEVTVAAPYISAEVYAFYNGDKVMESGQVISTNSTYANAQDLDVQYANMNLSGNGVHSVWSSSYPRHDHLSSF